MKLDDLNFTDDLDLPSHTQQQMQEKTNSVAAASAAVGLNIHKGCECADRQGIKSISTIEEYLELKTTVNCQHRSQNFQYKCQNSSTLWGGNLDNYESHHSEYTRVYQQLSMQNTSDQLVRHYQQQITVGENKPDSSGGRNQEETLEEDRTHIEEKHTTASQDKSSHGILKAEGEEKDQRTHYF
ncbi:unnamed protein product [Schistosoma margrebowiei]|uniref:Uncharacterized protein n=1 Tax=Schistosoma margrebowiei TaxID=48269 RepID=A0A183MSR8_9TREM|nr:unnamed protein product [Schistosoma margrebowiei]